MICLWIVCVVLTVFVSPSWTAVSCDIDNNDDTLEDRCIEHGIVNRVACVFVLFFALQGFFSICFVKFFDNYWIFKFLGVIGLSLLLLIPSTNFFDNEGFQYIARIGGFLFIIFIQILLLDFCYYWKKGFIDKSSTSGRLTSEVASDCMSALNNVWLCALLAFSIIYILIFVAAMSLLFAYFAKDGCDDNKSIITISLIMMLCALVIQVVFSKNGSIIASGILACYGMSQLVCQSVVCHVLTTAQWCAVLCCVCQLLTYSVLCFTLFCIGIVEVTHVLIFVNNSFSLCCSGDDVCVCGVTMS